MPFQPLSKGFVASPDQRNAAPVGPRPETSQPSAWETMLSTGNAANPPARPAGQLDPQAVALIRSLDTGRQARQALASAPAVDQLLGIFGGQSDQAMAQPGWTPRSTSRVPIWRQYFTPPSDSTLSTVARNPGERPGMVEYRPQRPMTWLEWIIEQNKGGF